ncbi:hypothetical protein [Meiothermus hypogaeus]|uniref:Uncharacterized protein n=1 Tax=Meiothermus hypogaeus NBRC 106114 TaxID=1227553 RepID=A0A511QXU8_9DEIN|nr:hypothetical protein [Meiothermus hypogaeus]GEM82211.1 hypothetical protein MHY01S_03770 [Meiothermus hypogaeus NBRC 106114]
MSVVFALNLESETVEQFTHLALLTDEEADDLNRVSGDLYEFFVNHYRARLVPTRLVDLEDTLKEHEDALEELGDAQIARDRYREALEIARAQAVLEGRIQGKNADEREAYSRTLLAEQYQNLRLAEERLTRAKAQAEIARSRFEMIKALLAKG